VERFLSDADESVSEQTLVSASAERTYRAIDAAEVSGDRVLGPLGGLADLAERLGGDAVEPRRLGDLLSSDLGFVRLTDTPGSLRVVGLVLRYSAFDRAVERVDPKEFAAFAEPGHVKVVLAFTLEAQGGDRTVLGCDVRIRATDDDTRSALRSIWFLASPALRLGARRLIELIRREAESGPQGAEGGDRNRDHDDAAHLGAG
jgi:hypothetical protein